MKKISPQNYQEFKYRTISLNYQNFRDFTNKKEALARLHLFRKFTLRDTTIQDTSRRNGPN